MSNRAYVWVSVLAVISLSEWWWITCWLAYRDHSILQRCYQTTWSNLFIVSISFHSLLTGRNSTNITCQFLILFILLFVISTENAVTFVNRNPDRADCQSLSWHYFLQQNLGERDRQKQKGTNHWYFTDKRKGWTKPKELRRSWHRNEKRILTNSHAGMVCAELAVRDVLWKQFSCSSNGREQCWSKINKQIFSCLMEIRLISPPGLSRRLFTDSKIWHWQKLWLSLACLTVWLRKSSQWKMLSFTNNVKCAAAVRYNTNKKSVAHLCFAQYTITVESNWKNTQGIQYLWIHFVF